MNTTTRQIFAVAIDNEFYRHKRNALTRWVVVVVVGGGWLWINGCNSKNNIDQRLNFKNLVQH